MKKYKLSIVSPKDCLWKYWFFDFSLCGMMWFIRILGIQLTCYYKGKYDK